MQEVRLMFDILWQYVKKNWTNLQLYICDYSGPQPQITLYGTQSLLQPSETWTL